MASLNRRKIELEFNSFITKNFVAPSACRDLDQTRGYVKALCLKIDEYQSQFGFVPARLYTLLAQYNSRQNELIRIDFCATYSPL